MIEVILIELLKSDREAKEIILILFFIVLFEVIKRIKTNERTNKSDNKK